MQRGDADHIVGSPYDLNCGIRVQDIRSRSSLEDLDLLLLEETLTMTWPTSLISLLA
jgi:hypothetical protein